MCKLAVEDVRDGLIPSEKIVKIKSATGGTEELSISAKQVVDGNFIIASEIARGDNKVLVELPRETATGLWRMWIDSGKVTA